MEAGALHNTPPPGTAAAAAVADPARNLGFGNLVRDDPVLLHRARHNYHSRNGIRQQGKGRRAQPTDPWPATQTRREDTRLVGFAILLLWSGSESEFRDGERSIHCRPAVGWKAP